jgi:hypothetical protein
LSIVHDHVTAGISPGWLAGKYTISKATVVAETLTDLEILTFGGLLSEKQDETALPTDLFCNVRCCLPPNELPSHGGERNDCEACNVAITTRFW